MSVWAVILFGAIGGILSFALLVVIAGVFALWKARREASMLRDFSKGLGGLYRK